ncbi:MAG: adenylate/guanylate cyclase domain-containing protein [Oscillospiraceae bacterium]|nr:adenylate/guanylate cyclase domain-containing protein [Oscillospiraceae bacterium]
MKKYITAVIAAIIAFFAAFSGVFGALDLTFGDVLYHKPGSVSDKIRSIKSDEKTLERYGEYTDWDRGVYADLVEVLNVSEDIRPSVIGFDVLFASEKNSVTDNRFAEVCGEYGNVVCGFNYVFTKKIVSDENGKLFINNFHVSDTVTPYKSLADNVTQGFVTALLDETEGIIRKAFIYFTEEDGTKKQGFSTAVYEKYMDFCGKIPVYPTVESSMLLRYSGGVSDYENVSLCDVIDGKVPAETFDDCIVLVGAYAPGMMDAYYVPVDRGQQMYGVEIHANTIQAFMDGKMLSAFPGWVDGIIAAVVAAVLVLVCEKLNVLFTIVICLGTAALKLVVGGLLFNSGYIWDNLTVPVMSVIIGIYFIALHYYKARAAKMSIEKAFSKYVAPQVVKEIARNGNYEIRLGGENRDVAVLFVDIRGFTPLSESLEPEQVVDILNSYLELTTNCIFRHGGTLDKFIGDATMAVFNAPFDTEDYVYKAVLAAWDIVQGGNKIEEQFVERYGKHVGFGVGVNCGPAVVGNIGCDFRMDYTAIGDTVNTAARLEANAPRSTVYISDSVYEQVKDRITVEEVGEIPLKGKSKGVFVYSVTGINNL